MSQNTLVVESVDGGPQREYRWRKGAPERRELAHDGSELPDGGSLWRPLRRADLIALPPDGPEWPWLAGHGVRRVYASGPSGRTQAEDERANVRVVLRIPPEAAEALERLAAGTTKSSVVADLVVRAWQKKVGGR